MEIHRFDKSIIIGEKGEEEIIKFLQKNTNIKEIKNVSNIDEYRLKDIDLIVHFKNGQSYSLEIKTDTFDSGNIFYETLSCIETQTLGCFEKTQADYIFYFFIKTKELYILKTNEYRKWFHTNIDKFNRKEIPNMSRSNKSLIYGEGYTIKKKYLESQFKYYKKYILQ